MQIKEIENKLFLGNQLEQKVIDKINSINKLSNFIFKNERQFIIEDTYFDSVDFVLGERNSYLRLRNKNDESYITIRLRPEHIGTKSEFDEFTHPLNLAGLRLALQKLKENNVIDFIDFTIPDFVIALEKCGLFEVLRVHNDRMEKEIWLNDVKIGRIKIDHFYYKPLDSIKFLEIETDIYNYEFENEITRLRTILINNLHLEVIMTTDSKYKRGFESKMFSNNIFYNKP